VLGAEPWYQRIIPVLIVILAMAVYANSLRNGFVLDDEGILVHNDVVHGLNGVWRAFVTPWWPNGAGQYRPLVVASFSAEWTLWGGSAAGFHAVNVLWHAAATLLVYVFLRRWLSFGGSAIAAVLFAVHPVHVEAVANVVGRAELMAACGILGMLILHSRRSPWAVAAFAAALLSKEHALIAPVLALVVDVIERPEARSAATGSARPPGPRVLPLYAGYAMVALVWAVALVVLFRNQTFTAIAPLWLAVDARTRWLTMLGVVPVWVRLWFFPLALSADYSPRVVEPWPDNIPLALLGAAILLTAGALTMLTWRRAKPLVLAMVWIAVTMLPVANLIVPTGIIVAERTLYLSSIGAVLVVGFASERIAQRRADFTMIVAGLFVVAASARTWTRNLVWKSNRAVFLDAVAQHPEASWTHASLGKIYSVNRGYSEALGEYRLSLALFDGSPGVWADAIFAAAQAQNLALADSLVAQAVKRMPGDYKVSVAHAYVALEQHRYSESLRAARAALAVAPDSAEARMFEAFAWAALGVPDSARRSLARIGVSHPLRSKADSLEKTLPPPGR
jgi:hypothetical protein